MEKFNQELYTFTDAEHLGGQHKTYTENCYECYKENRLLKAKQVVDKPTTCHCNQCSGRVDVDTRYY